jgi:hypothetical protein
MTVDNIKGRDNCGGLGVDARVRVRKEDECFDWIHQAQGRGP